jgi:hypothetical protein
MSFELPGLVVAAENRRMGAAPILQPKQSTVLRIDIEEKRVFDAQLLGNGGTVDGKSQDLVGAVAVVVDQMFDNLDRAAGAIGGNHQPGQCIAAISWCFALTSPQVISSLPSASSPIAKSRSRRCDVPVLEEDAARRGDPIYQRRIGPQSTWTKSERG